jgi:hypothetical protein
VRIGGIGSAALSLALLAAPSARADGSDFLAGGKGPDLVAAGIGVYDVLHNNTAAQVRGEYRFGYSLFFLEPLVGALVTSDGSFYGYGGLRADLIIAQHYVIMPVATVGYWSRGGGKDLGAATEFKTGAEFAYRFAARPRLRPHLQCRHRPKEPGHGVAPPRLLLAVAAAANRPLRILGSSRWLQGRGRALPGVN